MSILDRDFSDTIVDGSFDLQVGISLIQTLILGGDYVPIVIVPLDGEVEFYAGNDLVIQTTILDDSNGNELEVDSIISASYLLRKCNGDVVVNNQMDNGIFINVAENQINVEINRTETMGLSGKFRHELQIVSATGYSTLFSSEVTLLDSTL